MKPAEVFKIFRSSGALLDDLALAPTWMRPLLRDLAQGGAT